VTKVVLSRPVPCCIQVAAASRGCGGDVTDVVPL